MKSDYCYTSRKVEMLSVRLAASKEKKEERINDAGKKKAHGSKASGE